MSGVFQLRRVVAHLVYDFTMEECLRCLRMPRTKHEQGRSGTRFAKSKEERPMKTRFGKTQFAKRALVRKFGKSD